MDDTPKKPRTIKQIQNDLQQWRQQLFLIRKQHEKTENVLRGRIAELEEEALDWPKKAEPGSSGE